MGEGERRKGEEKAHLHTGRRNAERAGEEKDRKPKCPHYIGKSLWGREAQPLAEGGAC